MAKVTIKKSLVKRKKPFARVRADQHDVHQPLIKPPKLLRQPKLTVKQLFKYVDQKKREAAKDIAIKAMRTMRLPKNSKVIPPETLTYRIQTYSKHNKHIHNVTIMLPAQNEFSEEARPIIDCSCSSHIFHAEYNLAKRGNAFLWRCNGMAPTVNTQLTMCKHSYVALRYMLRRVKAGRLPKKSQVQRKLSFSRGV